MLSISNKQEIDYLWTSLSKLLTKSKMCKHTTQPRELNHTNVTHTVHVVGLLITKHKKNRIIFTSVFNYDLLNSNCHDKEHLCLNLNFKALQLGLLDYHCSYDSLILNTAGKCSFNNYSDEKDNDFSFKTIKLVYRLQISISC